MKTKILFLFALLALASQTQATTVTPALYTVGYSYQYAYYLDPSGLISSLTVQDMGTYVHIAWESPFGVPPQNISFGREYDNTDYLTACPATGITLTSNGIRPSLLCTPSCIYTLWDAAIWFSNYSGNNFIDVPYNNFYLGTAVQTDGIEHTYYLELAASGIPTAKVKVLIHYTAPNVAYTPCGGTQVQEPPVLNPLPVTTVTSKPGRGNNGKK